MSMSATLMPAEKARITRRWQKIDQTFAWCGRPLRPDLAALDSL
jgi:hypothetical protein